MLIYLIYAMLKKRMVEMEELIINVIIIDDEIWALQGIKKTFDWEMYGFKVTGEYSNPQMAIEAMIAAARGRLPNSRLLAIYGHMADIRDAEQGDGGAKAH